MWLGSLGRRIGILGFVAGVYGNMAYCDAAGLRSRHLSFCSDSSSLVFYQCTSHIYLYSHGGIKWDRIDVNGF